MDSLRANLTALEGLERKTVRVPDAMSGTGRLLDKHSDAVGAVDVYDALRDFESHWKDGRTKIREKSTALGSMLRDTVRELRATDEHAAKSLESTDKVSRVTPGARRVL